MAGRTFVICGAVLGGLGVAAGAFGAHSLKALVTPDLLAVFETGARYQMYHALALLIAGGLPWAGRAERSATVAGWAFLAGVALFSGSLYALTFGAPRWLGAVTPLGGLSFIVGWGCLAAAALRQPRTPHAR